MDAGILDLADARLVVRAVGADMYLGTGIGTRRHAALCQRHAEQCNGHLLTGGQQHVEFARHRRTADLVGQFQQPVGFPAHGGHDHDDIVAAFAPVDDLVGHRTDTLGAAHRGAAVFLND